MISNFKSPENSKPEMTTLPGPGRPPWDPGAGRSEPVPRRTLFGVLGHSVWGRSEAETDDSSKAPFLQAR